MLWSHYSIHKVHPPSYFDFPKNYFAIFLSIMQVIIH